MSTSTTDRPFVLVTGCSGLIGAEVTRTLSRSYRIIGLDRDEPDRLPPGSHYLACDLTADDDVVRALAAARDQAGGRLASVIHLAAYYDFSGEPSPLYDELTVAGTRRLLEGLRRFDRVEQIVFSSSLLVMRPSQDGEKLDERSPVQPEWDYPQSKLEAERVIADRRGPIPAVILRIAGVYDDEGHCLPIVQQIRRIYEKKLESYLFPGNPEHGQPFVHLDDVADCIQRVVDARDRLDPYEVFLVAEPDLMTYAELQDRIGVMLHGEEWPTIRVPSLVAKAGAWLKNRLPGRDDEFIKPWMVDLADAHYPVSIDRSRERLGWNPARRLRSTLDMILNRLVDEPARFYGENDFGPPPGDAARLSSPSEPGDEA